MGNNNVTPMPLPGPDEDPQPPKPIPTNYHGCVFRSRGEARVATLFDSLKIDWYYEPEGFVLQPFGVRYLPDFHLPQIGAWIEVKSTYLDERERRKTYLFNRCLVSSDDAVRSRERAFILYDLPWPHPKLGNIIGWEDDDTCVENLCLQECPLCSQVMIAPIETMSCRDCLREIGFLVDDALNIIEGIPELDKIFDIVPAAVSGLTSTEFFRSGYKTSRLQEAYKAARSARFEDQRYLRAS